MAKTGIFLGSCTGNIEQIAKKIKEILGEAELLNVASVSVNDLSKYDNLILGSSTWGNGELQDDWYNIIDDIPNLDLSGKKVALFGAGDQEDHPDTFVSSLGILYETITKCNPDFIGFTTTDGYDYIRSDAELNGKFVGLVLDEDSQPGLTDERIKNWVAEIKTKLN